MSALQNDRIEHLDEKLTREIQIRMRQKCERESKLLRLNEAWHRIIDSVNDLQKDSEKLDRSEVTVDTIMEKSKKLEEENFAGFIENNFQIEKMDALREDLGKHRHLIEKYEQQSFLQGKSYGCQLDLKRLEALQLEGLAETSNKDYYDSSDHLFQLEKGLKKLRARLGLDTK